jgi:hypothetical protein
MISLQKHNGKQYLMFGEAFIGNNVVNVYMEYGMEYGVWSMEDVCEAPVRRPKVSSHPTRMMALSFTVEGT